MGHVETKTIGTYRVKAHRLEVIPALLEKSNKKARKLGLAPATWAEVSREDEVYYRDPHTGVTSTVPSGEAVRLVTTWVTVEVRGPAPKFAGWGFLATLEGAEGGNILRTAPGTEGLSVDPRYRAADPSTCEHCRKRRHRAETFILVHEDGRQAQVGRQCLRDFLGHEDPKALVAQLAWLDSLNLQFRDLGSDPSDEGDYEGGSYGGPSGVHVEDVLATTAAVVRDCGNRYVTSSAAKNDLGGTSTAQLVWLQLFPLKDTPRVKVTNEDRAEAAAALALVRETFGGRDDLSDFEHNLLVAARSSAVSLKSAGIACYIIEWARRERGVRAERAARAEATANSAHQGTVGQRLRGLELVVTGAKSWEGSYGWTTLVSFLDTAGNVFKWFASGDLGFAPGDTLVLDGTVKAHDDFKGVDQTVLTRCTIKSHRSAAVSA